MKATAVQERARAWLLGLMLPLAGCGTFHVLSSTQTIGVSPLVNACNIVRLSPCERIRSVYGGAAFDVCALGFLTSEPTKAPKDDPGIVHLSVAGKVGVGALLVVDLPHSLVLDTFFLPVTIVQQIRRGDSCPELWSPYGYEQMP